MPSRASSTTSPVQESNWINVSQVERVASAVGGGLMMLWGLRGFPLGRLLGAVTGGVLVYRGVTGHCPAYGQLGLSTAEDGETTGRAVRVEASVTVDRPQEEVYAFWRELENLPRFMQHLASVEQTGETTSHWEAPIPGGAGTISWNADITEEEPHELLAWQSRPDAAVRNAGVVRFAEAPGRRGTEVHAVIEYRPPAGELGATVARFLNPALRQMIKEDLRRFKHIVEAGETPTVEGQPAGP